MKKINKPFITFMQITAITFFITLFGIFLFLPANLFSEDKKSVIIEQNMEKEAEKEEADKKDFEILVSPDIRIKEVMDEHLEGTGLQFSFGSPGGARPVQRRYEGYPDFPPLRIIPPEKASEKNN